MTTKGELVVEKAKGWLGTPYHSQAKVKGAGVDCVWLLIAAFEEAGILKQGEYNPGYYSPEWHLHRSEEKYLHGVHLFCDKVEPPYQPGDIALFKFGRCVSHGAIVVKWPVIIHAYIGLGVIQSRINEAILCKNNGESRLHGVYRWRDL